MGLFGDDSNPDQDQANALAQEQIDQNKAELEQKREALVEQRMNIIHSQGAEQWTPDRNASAASSQGSPNLGVPPFSSWFGGKK